MAELQFQASKHIGYRNPRTKTIVSFRTLSLLLDTLDQRVSNRVDLTAQTGLFSGLLHGAGVEQAAHNKSGALPLHRSLLHVPFHPHNRMEDMNLWKIEA